MEIRIVEYHNKSFFGSKVGMFFDSGSWTTQHFYLKFIRKRGDGTWEKPSKREGKSIKFSLEDVVLILRVLRKEGLSWKRFIHLRKIRLLSRLNGIDKENSTLMAVITTKC